jgi:hypothetical protein
MKWRSIETAPTDGTDFLVTGGQMESELATWDEDYGVALVSRTGSSGSFGCPHTCYYSVWVNNPTHWTPLPKAPVVKP